MNHQRAGRRTLSRYLWRAQRGFLLIEMVAALVLTSLICVGVLLALVQFEESAATQELEVGVLAQLRYQAAVIRGLPLPTLQSLFATANPITRQGVNDQKLYGLFCAPTRQATVTWQLSTADVEASTGETLLAVTAVVSAPLSARGSTTLSRQVTVYRALE
jgi:type II secretory pathway pseudopilin PulG